MIDSLMNYFSFVTKEVMVFLVAMMPVAELRFAIPLGVSLGIEPMKAAFISIAGSMIPVPFILLFLRPFIAKFKHTNLGSRFGDWIKKRTMNKSKSIKKYRLVGLLIFVAVPLPTTGVWTGSAAAAFLDMRIRDAMVAVFLGNCIAAFLMTWASKVAWGFF